MALEQEVQARQADVTGTQQIAQQMTTLAPALALALDMAGQFAATLVTQSQALAALAPGVQDTASATQAITTAQQIQQQCQAPASTLGPAEQAWNSVTSLAQQRSSWLLSHWQQTHQEPPSGTPIALADPLAQALDAYSAAAAQLAGNIVAAPQFPPAPAPAGPTAVAAWLQSCSQRLAGLASGISATAGQLGGTLSWATLEGTAASAVTAAQASLAAAQRVAGALAGPVDPASLAGLLADLSTLRLNACPDPIVPADRALYGQRMAELVQALTGLLAGTAGATALSGAATADPIAMLPVRLETRAFPTATGGTEFRIRVYVDNIQVNAHDPRLTADEAQWAAYLASAAADGGTLTPAQWAQAAARFGPARAAYLLNPDPSAATRPGSWAQAATTTALPDRWLAIGYGPDGTANGAALGAPITVPLAVGPDPTAAPAAAPGDELAVDPGIRWLIDYDAAVSEGMGISLLVDGGAAGTPAAGAATGNATLSRLLVVGVRAGDATQALADLLNAHHFTSGLELVGHGTPTNNTGESGSGYSRADPGYQRSYAREILRPAAGGDGARLAAALGITPAIDPGIFAAAAPAPFAEQQEQQAMTALTWPATWGPVLTELAGMGLARAEQLRTWAVAWLRPGGPLPAIRIGSRPYGVLPVVDLAGWAPDPGDSAAADVHQVATGLMGAWLAADPAAAGHDIDALLARRPVSAEAWGRFAGIMPGWLLDGFDLGIGHDLIATGIGVTVPGTLTSIGSACGLGGPLSWPPGFLVLPDPLAPASPWPLVAPDGSLPWVAGSLPPGAYLTGLLAGSLVAPPTALLDFVARQSWAGTPGLPGGVWAFAPRGNLGDAPEPTAPPPADELHASVSYLAGRSDADFGSLFGGALDACSHRLDAWVTALATCRLGHLRAGQQTGIFIGGFGWVENLVAGDPLAPAPVPAEPLAVEDPYNAGYQQAPSVQQATTAAVLRSGYLTHNPLQPGALPPGPGAPFAIDLSSRRARLATWLLDGVRQGQPLPVLLGYRFERALQEAGIGDLIDAFRQAAPFDPVTVGGSGTAPAETVVPTDVVDGVALYRFAQASAPPAPVSATQWAQAQPALSELADAIDAVADGATAQALHDLLTGGTHAVAATLDGVATGTVPPPELAFLNTARTGISVNHRILVPIPAGQPSPPPHWPATPRGTAEPALNSWVASLLGDPAQVTAAVNLLDATGAPLPASPRTITLGSLGLGPLDVVALAGQPAELERLAVHAVISARPSADPPTYGGTLDANPAGTELPLSAMLSVAQSAGRLIGASRGADARDLAPAGTVSNPGADLDDLTVRVQAAAGALASAAAALAAALPGDPVPGSAQAASTGVPAGADPAALAAALVQAVMLGVPAAAPAGTGAASLQALADQARGAWAEVTRRQAAMSALEPPTGADPSAELAARLAQLAAAFGGGFRALPLVTTSPANLLAQAAALTDVTTADPGQGADAWLVKTGRVHEPVADLLGACCAAEALGTGPPLALAIGQLPLPAQPAGAAPARVPWAGLPFTGSPPAANSLSLVMAQPPPAGTLAALLVADWVEVIPSRSQITGIAYHYAAPDAQPPQAILLAVPARPDATTWSYGDLVSAVASARNLARVRGVDHADLPSAARLVLPAAYFLNPTAPAGGHWTSVLPQLGLPGTFSAQTLAAVQITSVSVTGAPLEQAKTGQIVVNGVSFAPSVPAAPPPLPPSAFTVDGGGVSVTGGTVTDTQATLEVTVDPQAATGLRSLRVGTFVLPDCLTIAPQPRATSCNTSKLSQGMAAATKAITVTGQALAQATVEPSTRPDLVTWQLTTASDAQVQVTATIAASSYQPYQDQAAGAGTVSKPLPAYRPPVYSTVSLTLTITPAPGEPANAFPITLVSMT